MEEAIALDSIQAIAASFGASFDAEKIVDTVLEKDGTRYYKVRWVKYSWEPAASFTHLEHLIRDFWNQFGQNHETLQTANNKRQHENKQINQVIHQELSTQSQQPNNRTNIPSILSTLSNLPPMVENITNLSASTPTLQLQQTMPFPQLSALTTGNNQPLEIVSNIQQLSLASVSQEITHAEGLPAVASPIKVVKERNTRSEEPKKRRKIPGNCPICGKHFKSTTNIAAHKKLHTEERQYECQECGRKFRRKLHLRRHLESHAGIKSFVCNICGSSFTSKWYMQAHSVIHTGDKPFQCDVCEKRFNNKANLNKHKLIHANKRPFVCNVCGHSYRQSYDLKRHMSTHSEAKNFICEHCDKPFARKTYLQRHLLTHNGEKKFDCSLCHRKFFQKGHLNFHMRQHLKGGLTDVKKKNDKLRTSNSSNSGIIQEDANSTSVFVIDAGEVNDSIVVLAVQQKQIEQKTEQNIDPGFTDQNKTSPDFTSQTKSVFTNENSATCCDDLKTEQKSVLLRTKLDFVQDHSNGVLKEESLNTKEASSYFTEQDNGILEFSSSSQEGSIYV